MIEPGKYRNRENLSNTDTLWILAPSIDAEHHYHVDLQTFAYFYVYSGGRAERNVQVASMSEKAFRDTWRKCD